jgi:hypothetical protein
VKVVLVILLGVVEVVLVEGPLGRLQQEQEGRLAQLAPLEEPQRQLVGQGLELVQVQERILFVLLPLSVYLFGVP